ncbi:hypothetical protein Bbelb_283720 [Branchiostoma belcheri]|nr:hypothetical protein Bbelb_283720 [Branchiostoma belcheri]
MCQYPARDETAANPGPSLVKAISEVGSDSEEDRESEDSEEDRESEDEDEERVDERREDGGSMDEEETEPGDSLGLALEKSGELMIDENPPKSPHPTESKRPHLSESDDSSDSSTMVKATKVPGPSPQGFGSQIDMFQSSGESSERETFSPWQKLPRQQIVLCGRILLA